MFLVFVSRIISTLFGWNVPVCMAMLLPVTFSTFNSTTVQVLNGEGPAPSDCSAEIMKEIVQQHLDCAAIFTVLPLQASLVMHELL